MTVFNNILKRRSIRKFTNQEVTDDKIKILLKAAMAAPSARGQQPWHFYVVKNKETQNKIKELTRYYNFNSPLLIVVAANKEKSLKDDEFWVQDCSAATQNLLLTATDLVLGTCWCGIYPKEEAVKNVQKILNLKDSIVPLSLIQVGYPAEEKEARTQYNPKNVTII